MNVLAELRRRNVIRMAALYLVGAWLIVQVAETLLPIFDTPDWVLKALVVLLALGFVPAMVFSWVFELTPEGLKRERDLPADAPHGDGRMARRLDVAVILMLLATVALVAWHRANPSVVVPAVSPDIAASPASTAALGPHSIAVLPFENFSTAEEDALFADGLADTVLHKLAQLSQLKVIARNSSFSYKGSNVDVRRVGSELGVASVLEGSVQRQGQRIRVIAQLVETAGGSHLWSQTYDRPIDDLFAIQDEIAAAVVKALAVELLASEAASLAGASAIKPEAVERLLAARSLRRGQSADGDRQPVTTARWRDEALAAARADPAYLEAWLELADAEQSLALIAGDAEARDAAIRRGYAALHRAMRLQPDSTEALATMGWLLLRESRLEESLALSLSLLDRAPNDTALMRSAGLSLMQMMRPAESLALQERALALDPHSAGGARQRGGSLMMLGRLDEARENHVQAIARFPRFVLLYRDLASLESGGLGDWPRSFRWLIDGLAANPDEPSITRHPAAYAALLGLDAEAEQWDARWMAASSPQSAAQGRFDALVQAGAAAEALALLRETRLDDDARWLADNRARLALLCWQAQDIACTNQHLADGLAALGGDLGDSFAIGTRAQLIDAALLGLVAANLGDPRGAPIMRLALDRVRELPRQGSMVWANPGRLHAEAELLAALGEREAALAALESSLPADDTKVLLRGMIGEYIGDSPFLVTLHDEPRYRAFITEVERRRGKAAQEVAGMLAAYERERERTP